jgi:hypothetical protein
MWRQRRWIGPLVESWSASGCCHRLSRDLRVANAWKRRTGAPLVGVTCRRPSRPLLRDVSCRSYSSSLPTFNSDHLDTSTNERLATVQLEALVERSRLFFQQQSDLAVGSSTEEDAANRSTLLESLLSEWKTLLSHDSVAGREVLDPLYDQWCAQYSFPPQAATPAATQGTGESQATTQLLSLWLDIYTQLHDGSRALSILEGWTLLFGSHLEWRPERRHYEQVLEAYAYETAEPRQQGAGVALEIVELLEDLSFTMKPGYETYLWAILCVAAASPLQTGALAHLLHKAQPVVLDGLLADETSTLLFLQSLRGTFQAVARLWEDSGELVIDGPTLTPWMEAWNDYVGREDVIALLSGEPHRLSELAETASALFSLYPACSSHREAAAQMRRLLTSLDNVEARTRVTLLKPAHFVAVMDVCSRFPTTDSSVMEDLLNRLQLRHQSRIAVLSPLEATESYNSLLQASLLVGAYREVFRLNTLMNKDRVNRTTDSLTTVLKAAFLSRDAQLAEMAVATLRRTIRAPYRYMALTSEHFSLALWALVEGRHKRADEVGQELFEMMDHVASEESSEVVVETDHFEALAAALSRRKSDCSSQMVSLVENMRTRGLEPTDGIYTSLLSGLGRQSSLAAAEQAEGLLQSLRLGESLDVRCYVAVMYAWANSGHPEALDRVEATFALLEQDMVNNDGLKPTRFVHRALLEAWAEHGTEQAAQRALEIIQDFETKAAHGLTADDLDVKLYTAAMRAVWRSKVFEAPSIVDALYNRLVQASEANPHNFDLKPDAAALTVVMQTWANSIDPQKAAVVWEKWQAMQVAYNEKGDLAMKPPEYAAAAVLHACAFTTTTKGAAVRQRAVEIALELWQDIQDTSLVNHVLFALLLRVLGRQVDDQEERVRLVSLAFQQCCVAGCVSSKVVDALQMYAPSLYKQLPTNGRLQLALPLEWTRQVRLQS